MVTVMLVALVAEAVVAMAVEAVQWLAMEAAAFVAEAVAGGGSGAVPLMLAFFWATQIRTNALKGKRKKKFLSVRN